MVDEELENLDLYIPSYVLVDNDRIIGLGGPPIPCYTEEDDKQVQSLMQDCEVMICEGIRHHHHIMYTPDANEKNIIAKSQIFKDIQNKYSIESVLHNNSVNREFYAVCDLLEKRPGWIHMSKVIRRPYEERALTYLTNANELNNEKVDITKTFKVMDLALKEGIVTEENCSEIGHLFTNYFRKLKDAEILWPLIVDIKKETKGIIFIATGLEHVECAERSLKKQSIKHPGIWPEYKTNLPEQHRATLGKIEELCYQ